MPASPKKNEQDAAGPRWPEWLSAASAAAYMDCGKRTVFKLVAAGTLPRPTKLGASSRWRRADLDAALAKLDG